uniref:type III secretion apparatus protein OrgA/MxiK n=1 Tax=Yersinia frederiksenii TaxID=29484 RepID=UPI001F4C22D8|nr:type III secretion apparatus protein OrgA/MxiK [Yersinia frederiksenii]ULG19988.1 invasion protein OrgA [Yersinia frederiksenii]
MNRILMMVSLNKILYDPLSYLHSQRLQLNYHLISTAICRSAVNDCIFDIFKLTDTKININTQINFWICHWSYLLQIAYLIGCHENREELMWRGRLLNIPVWARDFLKIVPIYTPKSPSLPLAKDIHSIILKTGYSGLIGYIKELPEPLRQRFSLSFPDCIDSVDSQFTVNPFILMVISQYVKANKTTLPPEICR